jgi:SAM-dependent methyltransferase
VRAQIGAHYTDPDKIMMIVEPVILRPLRAEWDSIKAQIIPLAEKASGIVPRSQSPGDRRAADTASRKLRSQAMELRDKFLHRLTNIRILDPACGSGNFLYLALQSVKDLENRVVLECEALDLSPKALEVGPEIVHGIEINPFAAELARTTIWIGDIQWRRRNGIYSEPPPILRKLEAIERRDALITKRPDGSLVEADWPPAEFIVGNPPFLGSRKMKPELGVSYVKSLRKIYKNKVANGADLVCYWIAKSWAATNAGTSARVGLVATNSIGGGASRQVLDSNQTSRHVRKVPLNEPDSCTAAGNSFIRSLRRRGRVTIGES